jgi:hypothetical protein
VVLLAELGLILGRNMLLLLQFLVTMSEGTVVPELALPRDLPVPADL